MNKRKRKKKYKKLIKSFFIDPKIDKTLEDAYRNSLLFGVGYVDIKAMLSDD